MFMCRPTVPPKAFGQGTSQQYQSRIMNMSLPIYFSA